MNECLFNFQHLVFCSLGWGYGRHFVHAYTDITLDNFLLA
jgi:hypothetical protein